MNKFWVCPHESDYYGTNWKPELMLATLFGTREVWVRYLSRDTYLMHFQLPKINFNTEKYMPRRYFNNKEGYLNTKI